MGRSRAKGMLQFKTHSLSVLPLPKVMTMDPLSTAHLLQRSEYLKTEGGYPLNYELRAKTEKL
jgi:hypothetical protein